MPNIRNNFMGWLAAFHNSFHLGKAGEWLLGFCGVFLVSIITRSVSLQEDIAAVLLFQEEGVQKNNLHQVIDVYALMFNLLIAVTGFWMRRYVFKRILTIDNYEPVLKTSRPLPFSFDTAMQDWQKSTPILRPYSFCFAQKQCRQNSGLWQQAFKRLYCTQKIRGCC
ncbi:MAG: PepSY domain-containing protein, partial [Chitinophagaceae bacterium]|nr:PepSY domain-containing protein [Chitinophagaceae bacterium]